MNEKIGDYELVATAGGDEWGLYYNFKLQEYQIFSRGLTVPLDRRYSGRQYPKAPSGRWRWDLGVWNKIIETIPGGRQKRDKPSTSNVDSSVCMECQTEVRSLDHFHTTRSNGGLASLCCPCAKIGGYKCRLQMKR